ncbi:DolP-mannose mannosyltransferase [Natrinema gelatinilyticum]|uniref:DolP-mannose mannosyltransferase n=1 Tax=Natrinema gelatinilyticum TaxID=2961571 RepID=UPI0020C36A64|nr:DolP-mannose mannosyltransferase [Natrinema gelatinilyticum]
MSVYSRFQIRSCWLAILGPTVVIVFAAAFAAFNLTDWPSPEARRVAMIDPLFFQHTGWYIVNGGVPYVDVWDVNPPVPFGITAVLALLSGRDMHLLHVLSVALTVIVVAASILLVGWVAYLVTGEDAAAVAAGLTMLVVPELLVIPLLGVRAQFYALFFGVCALALALRDRPFLAGALVALSAGSWQAGAAFALLVVGIAYQRTGRGGAISTVTGGGVVAGGIILVFAVSDALVPMVVETVLAPLVAGSPHSLTEHAYSILLTFGYGSLLLLVTFYGWALAAARDLRERWWIPAGGLILGFQVLFVDLDGSTDVFLWLVFVALGVALAVERMIAVRAAMSDRRRTVVAVVAVIGLLVLSGLVWNALAPPPAPVLQTMQEDARPDEELSMSRGDADVPPMETIYWEQMEPKACHYRLSRNEVRWIAITDGHLGRQECGSWPAALLDTQRATESIV